MHEGSDESRERGVDAERNGALHRAGEDRFDFERPPTDDVGTCAGYEIFGYTGETHGPVAGSLDVGDLLEAAIREVSIGDLGNFFHHAARKDTECGCGGDELTGGAIGDGGEAVEGNVPEHLQPAGTDETDGGTCSNDGRLPESDGILDGLRIVAVVADVEGTEFLVEDMAGLRPASANEAETTEDLVSGVCRGDVVLNADSIENVKYARVGGQQRRSETRKVTEGVGFECNDKPIDGTVLGKLLGGATDGRGREMDVAEVAGNAEALLGDGCVVATHEEADIVAGFGEARPVVAANSASADDGN